ncbi:MAG: type II secretion system protein GspC [Deltaproteobacteria bacterium]
MILSLLKKYVWVLNLLLIAGIAYSLATILGGGIDRRLSADSALKPPSDPSPSDDSAIQLAERNAAGQSAYDVIIERNIFGLASVSSGSSDVDPEQARLSTLNLQLLATVLGENSIAVIKNTDTGKSRSYFEGEVIDVVQTEKVKLSKIGNCIVVVERREAEKIKCKNINDKQVADASPVFNNQPTPIQNLRDRIASGGSETRGIKEVNEGVYEIEQKMLDELLSDPNQLLTQARVIPQADGLKMFAIRPSSIFFKIGLRNGDTIHEINKVKLNNIENALSLFEDLRGQSSFSLDITRRGQRVTYEYKVK